MRQTLLGALYDYAADNRFAPLAIPENLSAHAKFVETVDCFDFAKLDFEKQLNLSAQPKQKIASKWKLSILEDVCDKITDGSHLPPPDAGSGEFIMMSTKNINDGKISFDNPRYLTREQFEKEDKRTQIRKNDVLLSIVGSIGRSAVVDADKIFTVQRSVAVLKPTENVLTPTFLKNILDVSFVQEQLNYFAKGKTQQGIYLNDLGNVKIPLPPLEVQKEIVREVEAIEAQETADKQTIETLRRGIFNLIGGFALAPARGVCEIGQSKIEPAVVGETDFYLGLEHIESNTGKLAGRENAREAGLQSTKNVFKTNEVLYGKLRPYLNKVYLAEFDGVCSTDILVLRGAHPKLLKYALLHADFVSQTANLMKGISLPRLQVKDFLDLKLHSPAQREAENHVAEIEKLEAEIERAENRLAIVPAAKAAVLQRHL